MGITAQNSNIPIGAITTATFSSVEFNHSFGKAKKAAARGPVVVTHRGKPSHVLMTFADYVKLTRKEPNAAEALGMRNGAEIAFDPSRSQEFARAADLS
ncbi:MAG TPA: type II toxin-antitoxin system prevent-host-death family antitoxin [Acidobacteriaceae bacterium]